MASPKHVSIHLSMIGDVDSGSRRVRSWTESTVLWNAVSSGALIRLLTIDVVVVRRHAW